MTVPEAPSPHPALDLGLTEALARLSFAVQTALAPIAREHHLTVVQMRLLGLLRDREPTITELARHLRLDKSSVTGMIDRAEERGLVQRVASERDRRSIHIRMTELGRELAAEAAPRFDARLRALVQDLNTEDQSRLSLLLSAVVVGDDLRHGIDMSAILAMPDVTEPSGASTAWAI
jgi:DNA-binding MarR family transcriptional regulator